MAAGAGTASSGYPPGLNRPSARVGRSRSVPAEPGRPLVVERLPVGTCRAGIVEAAQTAWSWRPAKVRGRIRCIRSGRTAAVADRNRRHALGWLPARLGRCLYRTRGDPSRHSLWRAGPGFARAWARPLRAAAPGVGRHCRFPDQHRCLVPYLAGITTTPENRRPATASRPPCERGQASACKDGTGRGIRAGIRACPGVMIAWPTGLSPAGGRLCAARIASKPRA